MTRYFFLTAFILVAFVPVHIQATTILFLGDSLTAGYGVASEQAYPNLIEKKMKHDYPTPAQVINGSISGSTSASALSRLRWYQQRQPEILFLALGANDGLRGLDVKQLTANLEKVVTVAHQNDMIVILAGMQMPPNYGVEYTAAFKNVYPQIAEKFHLIFVPFLLDGVAGKATLNQADGIHPNAAGHRHIAQLVYPYIQQALQHLSLLPIAPTASQAIRQ
ncbi:arylesterase [Desulfogranum marinum]|uniref:arylesterase n=1 Tax=Desulfogranum marinum TaxID=453220 RepID=UPI0029C86D66|nr:arylesterase [Desulfogranum marinum]